MSAISKPPLDLSVEPAHVSNHEPLVPPAQTENGSRREALPSLLAFSALKSQVQDREPASGISSDPTLEASPATLQMLQDEVLDLVARRALGLTGADGIAIAVAEGDQIICRASAGTIVPDAGARLDPNSGFSGTCFRTGSVVRCDSVEADDRVNRLACLQLGARSMLAVPLLGRHQTLGLIEAFSADEYAFNEADIRTLAFFAEVILGALRHEENAHTVLDSGPVISGKNSSEKSTEFVKPTAEEISLESHPAAPDAIPSPPVVAQAAAVTEPPVAIAAASPQQTIISETPLTSYPFASHSAEAPSRPGLPVVVAVVVVACLVAGGLWWQMHRTATAAGTKPETTSAAANPPSANDTALANPPISSDDSSLDNEIPSETVVKPGPLPEVTSIRHWSSGNVSNVVVDLQDQVPYEAHRLSGPDRIYFDLHDASLNAALSGKTIAVGDPMLSRIRAAQLNTGVVRVVLDTTAHSTFSVSLEHDPYRLLVQIHDGGTTGAGKAKVSLFPATPEPVRLTALPATAQGDQARLQARLPKLKIVLDAGHGGWDLGTVGRKGLLEKDLVLDITQRLGKLLQNRLGSDVLYTRNDDFYISLDQRAASANSAQADLFVSVHANYSDMTSARGVETYYTQSFAAPGPQELNPTSPEVGAHPALTLTAAELKGKIQESRRLAAAVQQSMYTTLADQSAAIRNRGVKEASYAVLTGTEMPGILAEVSFVSSPADETNLQREEYRQRIAEALYRGIARYAASSPRVKLAKATTSAATP
jgi:N-acetylmuramoyl-L-alanine amidase